MRWMTAAAARSHPKEVYGARGYSMIDDGGRWIMADGVHLDFSLPTTKKILQSLRELFGVR